MSDSILPIALNKGLDLVTSPLMIAPGSIIDCLNYEITDTAGLRRIDGYERYDGYPTGAVYEFFRTQIEAVNPAEQSLIEPGTIISRVGTDVAKKDIGVVVGGPFTTNLYDVTPLTSTDAFVIDEELLLLEGGGFLLLESELGVLRLEGTPSLLGDEFIVTSLLGVEVSVNITSTPVPGRQLGVTAMEYIDLIRSYSAVLRALVETAPAPIAGLYWFEDRLLAAVNMLAITVTTPSGGPYPTEGIRLRWNGNVYRLIKVSVVSEGASDQLRIYMYPIGTTVTITDDLDEVDSTDTFVANWVTGVTTLGDPSTDDSDWAAIGYFNNPSVASVRGFTYLPAATSFAFDAGDYAGTFPPPVTFDLSSDPTDAYYVTGTDGTVLKVRLTEVVLTEGVFASGTGVGRSQIVILEQIVGTRDYLIDNDEIHTEYPTTATSRVMTVNGTPYLSHVAGTGRLEDNNTRYVWDTYNFYGQVASLRAYGTTGASRSFWADTSGWGTIFTNEIESKDNPKYLAYHCGKLALGFAKGSVLLSVIGEPYNFSGLDGAMELATGDDITGLLELPGDTLAVFGRRSVRKITGTTDSDTQLGTIAANSSCFNYTACLVGADAVYTGVNGITTLQQSAAYGDFVGERCTYPISNWLRPKLVGTGSSFESGGVALAYVVRSKSQYRLVLNTGEIVTVTLTRDGYQITFQNLGLTGDVRIPFAWTTEIDSNGHEVVFVRWDDDTVNTQAYQLENGWGFDGKTFNYRFDTAHIFNNSGANFMGVEKIRLYGQGYGLATLDVKSSGIEDDFDQPYHDTVQDISMPATPVLLYTRMKPVTSIIDQANWGLGIKLRFRGTTAENSDATEPSHICQALVLHLRTEGALDG
jgi:hypothetical protein